MNGIAFTTRLRFRQIRLVSKIIEKLSFHPAARNLFQSIGRSTVLSKMLVGFNRIFDSFASAQRYIEGFHLPSHEHPENVMRHFGLNQVARPSDYAVLFYLHQIFDPDPGDARARLVRNVLDIGGSAGNLFYCYQQYLRYPKELSWTVFELPENAATGRAIAAERGEPRLHFIERLQDCATADLVIISGSLHYFEALPSELLRHLQPPPKHVIINRTPVIDGPTIITVQDHLYYYAMSPARILSRDALLASMAASNYELIDQWKAPELHLSVPLDPKSSVRAYTGFYFRHAG